MLFWRACKLPVSFPRRRESITLCHMRRIMDSRLRGNDDAVVVTPGCQKNVLYLSRYRAHSTFSFANLIASPKRAYSSWMNFTISAPLLVIGSAPCRPINSRVALSTTACASVA